MYEIDPDGDLLIILSPTEEAFAPWVDPDNDLTESPHSSENNPTVESVCSQVTINDGGPATSDICPPFMNFKVSSKHMSLASCRFKKMLNGTWEEAKTIHEDGYRHVVLDNGFDPGALKLLLQIIHGKTREVPRSLDLETLAKVSVLVDDFGCYEEVDVFADIWLNNLPDSLPAEYDRDLVLWILVSSVFRKPRLLQSVTRTAIWHSTEPIQTFDLPIRDRIVNRVDEERQECLEQLVEILHDLFDKLRTKDEPLCSFQCDSMLLGAFIQQLGPHDLIWPKPFKPFDGFSLAKIAEVVRNLQSPAWCDMGEHGAAPQASEDEEIYGFKKKKKGKQTSPWAVAEEVQICNRHGCTLRDHIISEVQRLENSVKGLDLEKDVEL